jgi:hypothetical protein
MNELELIPAGFGLCLLAYYFRGILRLHRARVSRTRTITFWETWLRFCISPAILKDAFRCAVIPLGVFLGIEIAQGDSVEDNVDNDSETDHF